MSGPNPARNRLPSLTFAELGGVIGQDLGRSDWITITQERIDRFADATLDHQFIHVDPEQARKSSFGGTVAHGFLTMSLLPRFFFSVVRPIEGVEMEVNYGFNRLRLLRPVPVGSRLRAGFVLKDVVLKTPRQVLCAYDATVELQGADRPCLVAEWLMLSFLSDQQQQP